MQLINLYKHMDIQIQHLDLNILTRASELTKDTDNYKSQEAIEKGWSFLKRKIVW